MAVSIGPLPEQWFQRFADPAAIRARQLRPQDRLVDLTSPARVPGQQLAPVSGRSFGSFVDGLRSRPKRRARRSPTWSASDLLWDLSAAFGTIKTLPEGRRCRSVTLRTRPCPV